MKININTPIARVSVELPVEKAVAVMQLALNLACGEEDDRPATVELLDKIPDEELQEEEEDPCGEEPPEPPADAPPEEVSEREGSADGERDGHTGFLYARCGVCGKMRAFCAKRPVKHLRCDCGHRTELDELSRMHVKCKCGAYFKYRTNLVADMIGIDCMKCGAPVDLEWHERKGVYLTVE